MFFFFLNIFWSCRFAIIYLYVFIFNLISYMFFNLFIVKSHEEVEEQNASGDDANLTVNVRQNFISLWKNIQTFN
jgi:hypothetical protein